MQEQKFVELYSSGKTVKEACDEIGIPTWKGYELKQKLGIHLDRWQRIGMPKFFAKKTEEIIFGTILGDGSLERPGKCKYRKLAIPHSPKQKEYLLWFQEKLNELHSSINSSGDKWGTLKLQTPPHPRFDEMYEICYPGGKKRITQKWLDQLTPLSLAVWYMDDGGTQKGAYGCKIATCSFSDVGLDLLCDHLREKWDLRPKVRKLESDNNYPRLRFNSENANRLKDLIFKHVIPSMKYKFEWGQ